MTVKDSPYDPNKALGLFCATCPPGFDCEAAGTTVENVQADPGYFAPPDGDHSKMLECYNAAACVKNGTCAIGYTGTACLECSEESAFLTPTFTCARCPTFETMMTWIGAGLLGLSLMTGFAVKLTVGERAPSRLMTWGKIIADFVQINALAFLYSFEWESSSIGTWMSYQARFASLGLSELDLRCLDVIMPDMFAGRALFVKEMIVYALTPIILLLMLFPILLLLACTQIKGNIAQPIGNRRSQFVVTSLFSATWIVLYLLYPTLATKSSLVFSCVRLGQEPDQLYPLFVMILFLFLFYLRCFAFSFLRKFYNLAPRLSCFFARPAPRYMVRDLSVQCWSSAHMLAVFGIAAWIILVYTVGVPLLISILLGCNRSAVVKIIRTHTPAAVLKAHDLLREQNPVSLPNKPKAARHQMSDNMRHHVKMKAMQDGVEVLDDSSDEDDKHNVPLMRPSTEPRHMRRSSASMLEHVQLNVGQGSSPPGSGSSSSNDARLRKPRVVPLTMFWSKQMLEVRDRYSFLFFGFSPAAYWWETVQYLKKAMLVVVGIALNQDAALQCAMGTLILALACIGQGLVKPYMSAGLNRLEMLSLFVTLLTFFLGLLNGSILDMGSATVAFSALVLQLGFVVAALCYGGYLILQQSRSARAINKKRNPSKVGKPGVQNSRLKLLQKKQVKKRQKLKTRSKPRRIPGPSDPKETRSLTPTGQCTLACESL